MVPFPDAADRLSPSGPFLPTLSAGLVRGGSDVTREPVTYPAENALIFQRTADPNDIIQVPLPNFRPGNSILTAATVVFLQGEDTTPSLLTLFPLLNVGGSVVAVDNTFSVMGGSFGDSDTIRTLTQLSLWRPDPDVITEDPIIGWAGAIFGSVDLTILGGSATPNLSAAWFVAFEIGEDSITQIGPTTLIPVPGI